MDWQQRLACRADLDRIAAAVRLSPQAQQHGSHLLEQASDSSPPLLQLLRQVLLQLACGFILAGIATFFAWNWQYLGTLGRFGLLQSGLLLGLGLAFWRGIDSACGQAGLMTAFVFIGLLLAVFGQSYQTGADAFQLFLSWAFLALPLVIVARSCALLALWQLLVSLSLTLFWIQVIESGVTQEFSDFFGPIGWLLAPLADWRLALALCLLNSLVLIAWELSSGRFSWLPRAKRWPMRLSLLLAVWSISLGTVREIIEPQSNAPLVFAIYLTVVAVSLWFYAQRRLDLAAAALWLTSVVAILSTALARLLPEDETTLLILAIAVVAQASLGTAWLRRLQHRGEQRPQGGKA